MRNKIGILKNLILNIVTRNLKYTFLNNYLDSKYMEYIFLHFKSEK